jgi:hypothetical protein
MTICKPGPRCLLVASSSKAPTRSCSPAFTACTRAIEFSDVSRISVSAAGEPRFERELPLGECGGLGAAGPTHTAHHQSAGLGELARLMNAGNGVACCQNRDEQGVIGKKRVLAARSLDHLVGRRQQRLWDGEAERFGGREVDDEFEFG